MTTLLVVDDVTDARRLVRAALEPSGHTILEAADGTEALEMLESRGDIRTMLLDIRMPGLSGWEVLDEMRARSYLDRISVIMFSAHADRTAAQRALDAGADAYLEKPYSLDQLVEMIEAHIAGVSAKDGRNHEPKGESE